MRAHHNLLLLRSSLDARMVWGCVCDTHVVWCVGMCVYVHVRVCVCVPQYTPSRATAVPHRVESVLPRLMEEYSVDMWLMMQQEYGEDVVFPSIAGPTQVHSKPENTHLSTLHKCKHTSTHTKKHSSTHAQTHTST